MVWCMVIGEHAPMLSILSDHESAMLSFFFARNEGISRTYSDLNHVPAPGKEQISPLTLCRKGMDRP